MAREDTPIYSLSNEDLVVGSVTVEPFCTELVDMSAPANAKYLSQRSARWQHDPLGGPTGEADFTVGPIVDNAVQVDIQLFSRMRKKWAKHSGIRISFANNADGTSSNTNPTVKSVLLGAKLKSGLYKTTQDGKLSLVLEDLSDEAVYLVAYVGGKMKFVSPVLDFTATVVMPTFETFTSPAPNTLRLTGTGFSDMQKLVTSHTNGACEVANSNDPDQAAVNSLFDMTVVSWTDTEIEFTSTSFPTGTIISADLQNGSPNYVSVAECMNSNIDPLTGFAPFVVTPETPVILSCSSPDTNTVLVTGQSMDSIANLSFYLTSGNVQIYNEDLLAYGAEYNSQRLVSITAWTDTEVEFVSTNPNMHNGLFSEVIAWSSDNTYQTGLDFVDFEVAAPPAPDVTSIDFVTSAPRTHEGHEYTTTIVIAGTNLDGMTPTVLNLVEVAPLVVPMLPPDIRVVGHTANMIEIIADAWSGLIGYTLSSVDIGDTNFTVDCPLLLS